MFVRGDAYNSYKKHIIVFTLGIPSAMSIITLMTSRNKLIPSSPS